MGSKSVIGDNVSIGSLAHIDYGVKIGENTRIEGSVYIPPLSRIGKNVFIGPAAVLTNDPYPPSKRLIGVVVEDSRPFRGTPPDSRCFQGIRTRENTQVRALAKTAGLGVHDKPDSVEICFVPGGDHGSFIRQRRPGMTTAGRIVDTAGHMLAEHDGIENFTIGQRKGLGFAAGERRYVLQIIPSEKEVVVGDREELLAPALLASRVNWLVDAPTAPLSCTAKIRTGMFRFVSVSPFKSDRPLHEGCLASPARASACLPLRRFVSFAFSCLRVLSGTDGMCDNRVWR